MPLRPGEPTTMASERGLSWRIADALRHAPPVYWAARRAFTTANRLLPPVVIEGVPGPVHRNDLMIDRASSSSRRNYVSNAVETLGLIRAALELAGGVLATADVLDFGCGHGRVVRHLVTEARSVSACDLDHEGARFCARAFGVTPVFGSARIADVALGDYDAIWAGSVITHHPADACTALLQTLADRVRPGGVFVVTSADESTLAEYVRSSTLAWLLEHEGTLRRELRDVGAAYVTYPQNPAGAYGLGFQSDEWLDTTLSSAGLVPLWHRSGAWGAQAAHAWHRPVS